MANIDDLKARLALAKATKYALPANAEEEAALAKELVEQERRADEEGQEALRKYAMIQEARALASLPEDRRGGAAVRCLYDWPTHKRTMAGADITTGRGVIVVTAADSDVAARAVRKRSQIGRASVDFVDMAPETVNAALMKATLFPAPDVLQIMLIESEPFCQTAYQTSMMLAGVLARELSGKSES